MTDRAHTLDGGRTRDHPYVFTLRKGFIANCGKSSSVSLLVHISSNSKAKGQWIGPAGLLVRVW
jgi:hypothetical protein